MNQKNNAITAFNNIHKVKWPHTMATVGATSKNAIHASKCMTSTSRNNMTKSTINNKTVSIANGHSLHPSSKTMKKSAPINQSIANIVILTSQWKPFPFT